MDKKHPSESDNSTSSTSDSVNLFPIIVKNLSVGYGTTTIIDTFSFVLSEPTFLAIIGLNGSGKTTFIKALTDKIPFTGSISPGLSAKVAYLGQRNSIGFPISVKEMLLMGRYKQKHFSQPYNDEDEAHISELMTEMHLEHLLDKNFNELSGGEQQLLWIVQTLLQDQDMLVMDEPTQQLDLKNKKQVFDLLHNQVQLREKLVVCVTHDIHNLIGLQGHLINFSKPELRLEPLSEATVRENVAFLEGL